jgi:hypothetical protein
MWRRLDDLIDRAAGPADIASHRLELLAAQRYRSTGRAVPPAFVEAERFAALASMTAPILLKQIASVLDDEAVVIKGLEVAAYYPDASLRSFGDVDLLVREPEAAQRALLEAGFEEVGDPAIFVGIHHLRPLRPRGMVVPVEIHFEPKWIEGRRVPRSRSSSSARSRAPPAFRAC